MSEKFFITDPSTKLKSVSLTLMIVTAILAVIANSLEMLEIVKSTASFNEMMWASQALYFGRKMNINGKSISSEKAEQIENKVNE